MTEVFVASTILVLLWFATAASRREVRPWASAELGIHLVGWVVALRLALPWADGSLGLALTAIGGIALVLLQAGPAVGLDAQALGLARPHLAGWICGAVAGIGLAVAAAVVTAAVEPFLGSPRPWGGSAGDWGGGVVVTVVVLVPVLEELYFRGVVQAAVARTSGVAMAIVVSSLLFSGAHLDLAAAPGLFVLGFGFGFLRWKTDSILPSVVAHGLNNAVFLGYGSF